VTVDCALTLAPWERCLAVVSVWLLSLLEEGVSSRVFWALCKDHGSENYIREWGKGLENAETYLHQEFLA
jgi:hypothetical protein